MRNRWIFGFCGALVIVLVAIWFGLNRLDFGIPCQDGTWSDTRQTCIPDGSF